MRRLLLQLLVVAATAAWPTDIVQLLDCIGRNYRVEEISIMLSHGASSPGFMNALHVQLSRNESNYFRLLPKVISTEESGGRFSSFLNEGALFVIFARDSKDPVIEMQTLRGRGRRYCRTLFLLQRAESRKELRPFFERLWQQGFRTALIMVAQRRLYRMDPYPTLRVLQLSPTHDERSLFPPTNHLNFKGYKLRVPVQLDVPATFWYNNMGKVQLEGAGGKLFSELVRHLNVCLEVYPLYVNDSNYMDMGALIKLIVEQRIELSPHQFTTLQRSTLVDYSYPFRVVQRCFMVPRDSEIPRALYILLPFKMELWLCLLVQMLLLSMLHLAARYVRPWEPGIRLWALMGVPGYRSALVPERSCWLRYPLMLLLASIFVFSVFVIVQTYTTKLTSLLAVSLSSIPTLNLHSLFQLPYSILVLPSDVDAIVDSFGHEQQFLQQFSYTNSSAFYAQRVEMSPGYIYPISTTRWSFLQQQQRYMKHKRFWLSDLCYGTFPYQFQLRIESHFKDHLHHFELHVNEAGLNEYWRSSTYRRAEKFGFIRDFASIESYEQLHKVRPMELNLLATVFYLYLVGLLLSLVAFLCEIVPQLWCC
ncbi:uncharacterized protein LOC117568103 [Drosophila albomicans]|uniref:Uncharacterized protein LOC117568103 n=1 Tax=Drosophila albomicans TaxID=7291 RepID=A0A6P8WL51_DROAB|nr:uncharacterized protein LOC117568103 [Drosophila albomicans]